MDPTPSKPAPDPSRNPAGDGVVVPEVQAKGGQRILGMPVVLVVSTLAAAVLMVLFWVFVIGGSHGAGGEEKAPAAAARTFNEPLSQPATTPPANASAPSAPH